MGSTTLYDFIFNENNLPERGVQGRGLTLNHGGKCKASLSSGRYFQKGSDNFGIMYKYICKH